MASNAGLIAVIKMVNLGDLRASLFSGVFNRRFSHRSLLVFINRLKRVCTHEQDSKNDLMQ